MVCQGIGYRSKSVKGSMGTGLCLSLERKGQVLVCAEVEGTGLGLSGVRVRSMV